MKRVHLTKTPERPYTDHLIKSIVRTSIAAPTQWTIKLTDGTIVWARYRHGILRVGKEGDLFPIMRVEYGTPLSGCLNIKELLQLTGMELAPGVEEVIEGEED